MFDSGLPALNAARAALGLAPLEHLVDQFRPPGDAARRPAGRSTSPPTGCRSKVRYVGPSSSATRHWAGPGPRPGPRSTRGRSSPSRSQHHLPGPRRRRCRTSSTPSAALPVRVLVTLGGAIDAGRSAPARQLRRASGAPHDAVMREAAVVVTHGGHGTVMRALISRVPMLVIPQGRDQDDNAVRVAGAGRACRSGRTRSVEAIREACARLLADPSFRAAAATARRPRRGRGGGLDGRGGTRAAGGRRAGVVRRRPADSRLAARDEGLRRVGPSASRVSAERLARWRPSASKFGRVEPALEGGAAAPAIRRR